MNLRRGDVVEVRHATGASAPFNGLKAIVVDPDRSNSYPHRGLTTVLVLSPAAVSEPDTDLGYFRPEWLWKLDTTPARIDEPSLWGVVEATVADADEERHCFVRYPAGWESPWWSEIAWDDLEDPVLVRPGLDD